MPCSGRPPRTRSWPGCVPTNWRTAPRCSSRWTASRPQAMGLSLADIYDAIQLMLAPVYANDFNYQGRVLKVLLQADAAFRSRPEDLSRYYIPSSGGGIDDMVPLTSVVTADWTTAPPAIDHYNGYRGDPDQRQSGPGHTAPARPWQAMQAIVDQRSAPGHRLRVVRRLAAGDHLRPAGADPVRPVAAGGLPGARRALRELVGPGGGDAGGAARGAGRLELHLAARAGERRLFQGRAHRRHRALGQERHPDHRVRQHRPPVRARACWTPPWRPAGCASGPSS